jgi:hypothetical protein
MGAREVISAGLSTRIRTFYQPAVRTTGRCGSTVTVWLRVRVLPGPPRFALKSYAQVFSKMAIWLRFPKAIKIFAEGEIVFRKSLR